MPKRISVIKETNTGKNLQFKDNYTGQIMNKEIFVELIKEGKYENYHIRKVNGEEIPASNPDSSKNNNLG